MTYTTGSFVLSLLFALGVAWTGCERAEEAPTSGVAPPAPERPAEPATQADAEAQQAESLRKLKEWEQEQRAACLERLPADCAHISDPEQHQQCMQRGMEKCDEISKIAERTAQDLTSDCFVIVDAEEDYGPAPLKVQFTTEIECTASPVTISWDFGDGTTGGNEPSPTHVYEKPGEFVATVTVSAPDGSRGEDEIDISVEEPLEE